MTEPARAAVPGAPPPATAIDGYEVLRELALDLRWSWNHGADALWRELDAPLWDLTRNPWCVLQTAAKEHIQRAMADPVFRSRVEGLVQAKRLAQEQPGWFQETFPKGPLTCCAYFSMEFMLSEALPIYSGGLGNVAGDQLKAASDLGVPVIGIGLLYQLGYFRQVLDRAGAQQELYPFNDPGQLPIAPLRKANGEWLRLEIALPGYSVWLRAWEVQVGRVKLYLLDSNDAGNFPAHRGITSELYGGGLECRLSQEMILGLGGWRLLEALDLHPEVCHLNEGHAAFAALERARAYMEQTGQPFDVALAVTRAGNVFTTHTAVAAGFDCFPKALIAQYLGNYARNKLGITLDALLALGRADRRNLEEPFNMAHLAIRASGSVNGVSRLHGQVSRKLFAPLFPNWPEVEVPIGHVTNGVHMPTWDSATADGLWTEACGKDRWLGKTNTLEQDIRQVTDARLWAFRCEASQALVGYVRARYAGQLAVSGAPPEEVEAARNVFDPHALTLGFGRRFAAYKRPALLLHDPERLVRLLKDPRRPVQLVLAGKAHPADLEGHALIQAWSRFIARPEVRSQVVFLSDYDMQLTENLVQGVDVWLNTPRRPWEACGTSGMKVLVNGGLNLSELDGWWAEAYSPDLGWALGDGLEHGDDPERDAQDAGDLYDLLERDVVPAFFERDAQGLPRAWLARMRESMARLTHRFSATRTVCEYTEEHYLPAAAAYRARAADGGAQGRRMVAWREDLERHWEGLRFGEVKLETTGSQHVIEIEVHLNHLPCEAVSIMAYANGLEGGAPFLQALAPVHPLAGSESAYVYRGLVPASRPASDYTVRAVPAGEGVSVPLEQARIAWQR